MSTCGLMPAGVFRDLQTLCSKMFIHLWLKWSNNSSFFGVLLLIYSCSDWPERHIQSELSTDFFSHYKMNIQPKFFVFSPVKPKIPDHKTAGHVNSRPTKFQSGCWCSRVVPAISTLRKIFCMKTDKETFSIKTTRFHPAMAQQHRRFLQSSPWACVPLENQILKRSQSLEIVSELWGRGTYARVSS